MSDLTLAIVAKHIGAELQGDANLTVTNINTLQQAQPGQISFLANPVYKKYLSNTKADAVILRADDAGDFSGNVLLMANPYAGYARLTELFVESPREPACVHHSAVIAKDSVIGLGVSVGPNVVIESGVSVGDGCCIGASCFIGRDSQLGENTTLYSNVNIYHGLKIGSDCIFHAGTTIGADGFGFAPDFSLENSKQWVKIHQLGAVEIGNDVELGANTCIDRGALDNTVVGDGVKIDNLVQIGHNCKIGINTVISGCTAVAGSVEIGANCLIGGAVGIVGHISIADGVTITAMSLVTGSINKPGSYSSGTNCAETKRWRKNAVRFGQLEALNTRVKTLEKRLKEQK